MGDIFIGQVNNRQLSIGILFTFLFAILNYQIYTFFIVNVIFTLWYVKYISKKIDGITGDTLGALVELNEIIFLLAIYIMEVI